MPCFFVDDAVDPPPPERDDHAAASATEGPAADDGALGIAPLRSRRYLALWLTFAIVSGSSALLQDRLFFIYRALSYYDNKEEVDSLVSLAACYYLSCDALGRVVCGFALDRADRDAGSRGRAFAARRAAALALGAATAGMAISLALFLAIALIAAARGALDRSSMATLESLLLPTSLAGASAGAAQVAAAVLVCAWSPPAAKRDAAPAFGRAFGALSAGTALVQLVLDTFVAQLDMDENKEIIDDIVEYPLPPTQHHSGVCYGSACFGVTFGLGAASCLSALVFAVPCLLRDEAKADPDHEGSPLLPEPPPGPARTPPA